MSKVSKNSYFGGEGIPSFFSEEDGKDLFNKKSPSSVNEDFEKEESDSSISSSEEDPYFREEDRVMA